MCLLFLLQCGFIFAREQECPVDTVDMSDYRILPFDSLDFSGMARSVPLDLTSSSAIEKVVRAWGRLYVVYSHYDFQYCTFVQDIEIFDKNGGYLGRLGLRRSEVPEIKRTNYVEDVEEGAPDYSRTYLSVADVVWNGSEIIVSDTAGRKVLWYDRAGNVVKKRDLAFMAEGLAILDDGFLVGTGRDGNSGIYDNKVIVTDGSFSQEREVLYPVFRNGVREYIEPRFQSTGDGYFVNGGKSPYIYLLSRHDGSILKRYWLDLGMGAIPSHGKYFPGEPIVAGERYICGRLDYMLFGDEYPDIEQMNFIADRKERVIYLQNICMEYGGVTRLLRFIGYEGSDMIFLDIPLDDRPERSIIFVTFPL